jgi:hypothetical protein
MRRVLSLVAAVLLVAACSESSRSVDVVTDVAGFSVGLLDDGEEPRVIIRVADEAGTTQSLRMTVDQSMTMSAGGMTESSEVRQIQDITYTVIGAANGIITVETHFDDMSIEMASDENDAANQALIDAFVGLTATAEMTDRGSTVSMNLPRVEIDADIPGVPRGMVQDMVNQMFTSLEENASSLSVPTPIEPVGVGAAWTVEAEATVTGIPMRVTSTITLTDVSDTEATGRLDQTITFLPGRVDSYGPGVTATIEDGEVTGSGTIIYLLRGGIAPLVDLRMDGEVTITVESGGERVTLDQTQAFHHRTEAR